MPTCKYIGKCNDKDILEHDIWNSPSDMAYVVENSVAITSEEFIKQVSPEVIEKFKLKKNSRRYEYLFNVEEQLLILYNINKDIHYFFII